LYKTLTKQYKHDAAIALKIRTRDEFIPALHVFFKAIIVELILSNVFAYNNIQGLPTKYPGFAYNNIQGLPTIISSVCLQ